MTGFGPLTTQYKRTVLVSHLGSKDTFLAIGSKGQEILMVNKKKFSFVFNGILMVNNKRKVSILMIHFVTLS